MKKSDMVSELIHFHEEVFPSVGRGMSQKEYFTELLELLESQGMAPPFYDKVQDNNGEKVIIPAREWESEDE